MIYFGLDLETSGTDPRKHQIMSIGARWGEEFTFYYPIKHSEALIDSIA